MNRRSVLFLAILTGACRIIVGIDEHHLRDDIDEREAGGTIDANTPVAVNPADPHVGGDDGGVDASTPFTINRVTGGLTKPRSMVINHLGGVQYIFFIEEAVNDAGTVSRVPDTTGLVQKLATTSNPRMIRLDTVPGLFFTDDARPKARLMHVGVVPGTSIEVYDDDALHGFGTLAVTGSLPPVEYSEAVDTDNTGSHVRRTFSDAGPGSDCFLYSSPTPTHFSALNVDGTHVYIAEDATGSILRAGTTCGSGSSTWVENQHAIGMAFDSTNLYWLTADGHVRYKAKDDSGDVVEWNVHLQTPGGIGDDNAGNVYFTDRGAGTVYGSLQGAEPIAVAYGQGDPITVTASTITHNVYWLNYGSGEVMRAIAK